MPTITFDPYPYYKEAPREKLIEATGLLFPWALNWFVEQPPVSLKDHMEEVYGFGPLYPMGGELDKHKRFIYPGDEPMYPLLTMCNGNTCAVFYLHGIIAFIEPESTFITRMD